MKDSLKPIELGFTSVNSNIQAIAKTLMIPVIGYLAIAAVPLFGNVSPSVSWILKLILLIPVTLIAVTTHRFILNGPDSVPTWGINRFGWREVKFTLAQYVVLIFLIPVVFLFFIPYIGFLIGPVVGAYLFGRMSLVFPSIAIDKKFDFKDSWCATKNYKLMMFVVVAVFPFVLGMIGIMLGRIQGMAFVLHLISVVTTVYIVAALSIAYQIVMKSNNVR